MMPSDRRAFEQIIRLLHVAVEDVLGVALEPWILLRIVHRFEELCDEQHIVINYSEPDNSQALYDAITRPPDTDGA